MCAVKIAVGPINELWSLHKYAGSIESKYNYVTHTGNLS